MDYKSTLNLPKTDFPMKANLARQEPKILFEWERRGLYREIRALRKGSTPYVLHDGPPYANGEIHIGHAFNKILKDLIVKYKTMRGRDAPYQPGWDCHGMPIEHALFEQIGKRKQEVDQREFRRQAHHFAMTFVQKQREDFKRLGVFGEWEAPYLTLAPAYEAAIVRVFGELYQKGYIARRDKPVLWCATCETALADAEVEYEDREDDPAIYVKFPLKTFGDPGISRLLPTKDTSVLIWTTTPWTLPANLALCFHPNAKYSIIEVEREGRRERFILASSMVEPFLQKTKLKKVADLGVFDGNKVTNLDPEKVLHCFRPFPRGGPSVGVTDDGVALDEGTGIIHIAPGHGEEDYHIGKRFGLDILSPVDEKGRFTSEVPQWEGLSVFAANPKIIEELKKLKLLVHQETIRHAYPHCWRCKHPVIFRATEQWFLDVEHEGLRGKLLEAADRVQWIPESGKNRMRGMLEARPDWCLSRQRLWGVPIPIFTCRRCRRVLEDPKVFQQIERLFGEYGSDIWFEKESGDLLPEGTRCPCGGDQFDKEKDILDVWFDSGVSHEAVLKKRGEWPAALYLEGSDQHRGWFQVSLIPAVALEGRAPYQGVLTHGFVMDGEGFKMSKSRGNVVSPQEVLRSFGADILRLWVFSTRYSEDVRLSQEILERTADAYRKIRNTLKYLLGNLYDFTPELSVPYERLPQVDRWALLKLGGLVREVTEAMEAFEFHRAYQALHQFCVVEISSFYLDLLKDRLYTFSSDGFERRAGQTVLYQLFHSLCRMLAPVLSFTAEEAFQSHTGQQGSVHLESWPEADSRRQDPEWERRWETLLTLREEVLKAIEDLRQEGRCGSSLEVAVTLRVWTEGPVSWLSSCEEILAEILIVSSVSVRMQESPLEGLESSLPVRISVEKAEGQKCQRCWKWRKSVGHSPKFPDLCDRCCQVVEEVSR